MSCVSWTDVPLYWLDTGKALTDAQRIKALREYRETGGMYLVVMEEPTGSDSPEECERLSAEGPSVDEIDWNGFPVGDSVIVVVGAGPSSLAEVREADSDPSAWDLALDRGLVTHERYADRGDTWVVVVGPEVDGSDLDNDPAVVTYERIPADSPALARYRAGP